MVPASNTTCAKINDLWYRAKMIHSDKSVVITVKWDLSLTGTNTKPGRSITTRFCPFWKNSRPIVLPSHISKQQHQQHVISQFAVDLIQSLIVAASFPGIDVFRDYLPWSLSKMNEIPVDKPRILLLGSGSLFLVERGSEEFNCADEGWALKQCKINCYTHLKERLATSCWWMNQNWIKATNDAHLSCAVLCWLSLIALRRHLGSTTEQSLKSVCNRQRFNPRPFNPTCECLNVIAIRDANTSSPWITTVNT